MHIGLIGGIGVAATQVYYQRLVAAVDGPLELTIVHADVQTLIKNNLADDRAAQAAVYAELIQRLADAGADCAAITSLGGHFCFEETVAISALPLVSAIAPLDAFFASESLQCVGLLGTGVVMRTKLYGQLDKTRAVTLDDELDTVSEVYFDMASKGVATDQAKEFFLDAAARLVSDHGAEAVVLAGTDLGLVFDEVETDYRVVDALDVHVQLLADLGTGRENLKNSAIFP